MLTRTQIIKSYASTGVLPHGALNLAVGELANVAGYLYVWTGSAWVAATILGAGGVSLAMIAPNVLDGTVVKSLAAADVIGAIPVVHAIPVLDGSGNTDVVLTHKSRVLKFEFLNTGIAAHASADTVQLKNGTSAITDAVAKTATVNALVKAASYDPGHYEIDAGGTLRIAAVKSTNSAGIAYVTMARVA